MSVEIHELRVSAVIRETADSSSFELSVPDELRQAYSYRAGQHLTFKLPWGTFDVTRCYSLSDRPNPFYYRITVKRATHTDEHGVEMMGQCSGFLFDSVREGDILDARAPSGNFALDVTRSTPVALIGSGIGVTPMISMLNWILEEDPQRKYFNLNDYTLYEAH